MLNLQQMKTFLAVIKCGSFTRAAHELNLTQPAVSGHIAALEEEFGMPLFNRTGRKVVLTDAGEILMRGARDIFYRVDDLKRELADLRASRRHDPHRCFQDRRCLHAPQNHDGFSGRVSRH